MAWNPTDDWTATQTRPTHRAKRRNGPDGVALNLLASAITILAAIALLGTATVVGDTSGTIAVSARHERVIQSFYSAVNEAVRSGDTSALDRIVTTDLVFHPPSSQIAPNRAGLEHYLASIHDTFPAFQLRVEDLVSDGDRAVARVVGGSKERGGFLGLPLASAMSAPGHFDSFRIAEGRIVEIWSGASAPVLFEPATEIRLDLDTVPHAISFARLSASNAERREWGPFIGPCILYVDEGAITVDLTPAEPRPAPSTRLPLAASRVPVVVSAGEVMSIPPESASMLRHEGTDSRVTAFTVALPRFLYSGPYQPRRPIATDEDIEESTDPSVVQTALDGEPALDLLAGATVALGRALLPPGSSIAFDETDRYLFMVVETGALVLENEHNEHEAPSLDRLDAGALGTVKPGEPFALHNLGDAATVFMVTVLPGAMPASPAT